MPIITERAKVPREHTTVSGTAHWAYGVAAIPTDYYLAPVGAEYIVSVCRRFREAVSPPRTFLTAEEAPALARIWDNDSDSVFDDM